MKKCIRRYCNEGHNILSAEDMRTALSERPVKGMSACVCSVDEEKETLQVNKLDGFSKLHNIEFEEKGIHVWSYRIGPGKKISFNQLISKAKETPISWSLVTFLQLRINVFTNVKSLYQILLMMNAKVIRNFL